MSSPPRSLLISTLPIAVIFGLAWLGYGYWQGRLRPSGDRYASWRDQYVGDDPGWWCRWRPKADAPAQQYFNRLPAASPDALAARYDRWRTLRNELATYRPQGFDDSLHFRHIEQQLDLDLAGEPFERYAFALVPVGGAHLATFDLLIHYHPVANAADAKYYLRRVEALAEQCETWQRRLARQAQADLLPGRPLLLATRDQLRGWTELPPLEHPLYLAFARKASRAEMTEMNDYTALDYLTQLDTKLSEQLYPALNLLADQLDSLARQADSTWGIGSRPNGAAWYRHQLRRYSATDTSPTALLTQAEQAVSDWQRALRRYQDSLGEAASRPETAFLASEKKSIWLEKLRAHMRDQRQYVRGLMDTVPSSRLGIWPAMRGNYRFTPQYLPASLDGLHTARLRLDLTDRLQGGEAGIKLLTHEVLYPGRHLFMSRQLNAGQRPDLRRTLPHPAVLAGWEMYSSYLMDHDLAAYAHRPSLRLAYLRRQLGRAVNMRLDLGLHHQEWSEAEARRYLRSTLQTTPAEETAMLLAVASQPGKAVAAITGFAMLRALRQEMRQRLGDAFFLQTFHDQLLYQGALAPDLLRRALLRWGQNP